VTDVIRFAYSNLVLGADLVGLIALYELIFAFIYFANHLKHSEALHFTGKSNFFKKKGRDFPECLGNGTRGRVFFKKTVNILPRVPGQRHSGKRIFLKTIKTLPRVLHSGKRFLKKQKKWMALTTLKLPQERAWHSASPSARDLALGEGCFPVKSIPGSSSSSVALGEGFPECFCLFPECI
jgi:hypothetical protein